MTYMTHDTVTNTTAINASGWPARIANWLKTSLQPAAGVYIDPRNEHLLRDAGITPDYGSGAIDRRRNTTANGQPFYSSAGSDLRFIDMYISEHLDRGPRS